jgi:hypothetical protein
LATGSSLRRTTAALFWAAWRRHPRERDVRTRRAS